MHRLGHFANLSVSKIPETSKAFPIIEEYCKDLIYWPRYSAGDPDLLTTSYQVARIAFFLNRTQLHPEILRSPLNSLLSSILRYPILPELLLALDGTQTQGTLCGIRVLEYVSNLFIGFQFLNCSPDTSCKRRYPSTRLSLWTSSTSFAVPSFCASISITSHSR
jgi:hypothetical protein